MAPKPTMEKHAKGIRSQIMASVKSSGNKSTELALISIFKASSVTGWRRNYAGYGKPDFVFLSKRVSVFVDGCFWHKCPKHCRLPASNANYWVKKIDGNAKRDRNVTRELKQRGWFVFRFWEHDLKGGRLLIRKIAMLKMALEINSVRIAQ